VIDLGFLKEDTDQERLIDAVEMIRSIAGHEPFAGMIGSELMPGANVSDSASIKAALGGALTTYQHPTSTVPMGGPRDETAVVDGAGRVRGIAGLRVVDASIWPDVPSVATGFPTMMLAEKIAAGMV